MWLRCRPPDAEKLKFSFSALDLCRFKNVVYAAYVPGSDTVVIAGSVLIAPERPRGSSDRDSPWKSWAAVRKQLGQPQFLEWWSVEAPISVLPRAHKRQGAFLYGKRIPRVLHSPCISIPTLPYNELPDIVRRFWRSIVAKLFQFVDPLLLTAHEYNETGGYSQTWLPICWSHFGADTYYPAPSADLFINLFQLAKSCKQSGALPIHPKNLTLINQSVNNLFARLSHRYGFLALSTNHLLTFALADKIVESRWNGSNADIVLEETDIHQALRYWLDRNLRNYTILLEATPTDRLLHPYRIGRYLGIENVNLETSSVLKEDFEFLERNGHVDPNYIRVTTSTTVTMEMVLVPTLPLLPKNRRVCAYLYSIIHNDSFFAHFPLSAEPLPTILRINGETYALSALVNLSIERLEKSF
jgi:hypothetical protein